MANIHVIIGADDFLVGEAAKKIVGDGIGLEIIDSANSSNEELRLRDLREVEMSFLTPAFLEPKKITYWKNVRFLPGGTDKSSEAVKEALEKFADRVVASPLPENQHFVITGPKLLKTSVFAKKLATVAEMIVFETLKPWQAAKEAVRRVGEMAGELGLVFEKSVADKFVAKVGCDTRSLGNELNKLRDYIGPKPRPITAEDIDAVVSRGIGVEPEVWAITDALGARNSAAAVAAALKFSGERNYAVLVSSVAERFFRQLAELKDAEARGMFAEATETLTPWQVGKYRDFLARWRLVELRRARYRFMALREKAVSSAGSYDELVTVELVRSCGRI